MNVRLKDRTILLIDGENLLHQSFHKFINFKAPNGKPSGAIFGFFRSLRSLIIRFNASDVYITFDNGHSPFREALHPSYKGHRKNLSIEYESLQSQKKVILEMLNHLRIKYVFDKSRTTFYEGDDLLAYILLKYLPQRGITHKNRKFVIVSSDKDFNQLLFKSRIKIYNPKKDSLITVHNCKQIYGYNPEETVDYLIMVGDKSDDIGGFKGIGPVKARKILDKYTTVKDFLKEYPDEEFKKIYKRNKALIDILHFLKKHPLNPDKLPISVYMDTHIDKDSFLSICQEYSFKNLDEIIKTIIEYKLAKL